ncbi:MAG TPA: Rv3235 family protein [Nocardioides sp.]|nr:Rv3235 family protein [Nocardioides sp.]
MESMTGLRVPVPVASTQGTLALALLPRSEPPVTTRRATAAAVVPIDRRLRASIEEWARRFVQAAVEIVGGDRPVSQLLRWTTPDVYADLHRRALLVGRAGGHQPGLARVQQVRPLVQSVHACFITGDVVEAAAHVRYGERSRALAARFERRDQRWLCTALDFS